MHALALPFTRSYSSFTVTVLRCLHIFRMNDTLGASESDTNLEYSLNDSNYDYLDYMNKFITSKKAVAANFNKNQGNSAGITSQVTNRRSGSHGSPGYGSSGHGSSGYGSSGHGSSGYGSAGYGGSSYGVLGYGHEQTGYGGSYGGHGYGHSNSVKLNLFPNAKIRIPDIKIRSPIKGGTLKGITDFSFKIPDLNINLGTGITEINICPDILLSALIIAATALAGLLYATITGLTIGKRRRKRSLDGVPFLYMLSCYVLGIIISAYAFICLIVRKITSIYIK